MIRNLPSVAAALAAVLALASPGQAGAAIATAPAQASAVAGLSAFDAVVEAVHQTVVAAQVAGAVVQLDAKVGDRVKQGQILLRLDARAAEQSAAASDAQVLAARAALDAATQEYERQRQLFQKQYISQAALERAESTFKAARAQFSAQGAQAAAARTESGLHVIRAPFAGVIAEVPVALGDMAMPGRPLLTLYDTGALRVTAAVPQSVAAHIDSTQTPRIELAGLAAGTRLTAASVQVLPTVDPATHTVQVRLNLPADVAGIAPGMFARVWLPLGPVDTGAAASTVLVPRQAIVRRAEMIGLYVLDAEGRPLLRQVRLGRVSGDSVEILSGLTAGERVVTDPQAAARVR